MGSAVKVGVVGCGAISKRYLENAQKMKRFEVVAVSDLDLERAKARAAEFNIPKACTTDELLADPEIGYVLNLTIPQAHAPVAIASLNAGKSVYNEKPLAASREEAQAMMKLAKQKNLRIGCAPDTFMGAGLQACRRALDAGKIGEPIGAEVLFSLYPGPKTFDAFFWKRGGGILMDMGPYYFTSLVTLLGPVKRVYAATRMMPAPQLREKDADWKKKVEVPTHVVGVLEFVSGTIANVTVSYEVCGWYDIHYRLQGTDGTMHMPDPNMFGGKPKIVHFGKDKEELVVAGELAEDGRGIGLSDMAEAKAAGRPHRANDELAYHVLDLMWAMQESGEQGKAVTLTSTTTRPEPMPE